MIYREGVYVRSEVSMEGGKGGSCMRKAKVKVQLNMRRRE